MPKKKRKICGLVTRRGQICKREAAVPTVEKGFICTKHYAGFVARRIIKKVERICTVGECSNAVVSKGFCGRHYQQILNYGKILDRTRFDPNSFIDKDDVCEIVMFNRKHKESGRAVIDAEMRDLAQKFKWQLGADGYACTRHWVDPRQLLPLHHLVVGEPLNGFETDHINRNRLDNRRCNLRVVTRQQNSMNHGIRSDNTSGTPGVVWSKQRNKWRVFLEIDRKKMYFGAFVDKEEAAKVRHQAELQYLGEYAPRV